MGEVPKIIAFSIIEAEDGELYIVESINVDIKQVGLKLLSSYVHEKTKLDKESKEFRQQMSGQIERSKNANSYNKMKHLEFQDYIIQYL